MYRFKLNGEHYESASAKIKGTEILQMANLIPSEDYELLLKINEKGFEPVQLK